MTDKCENCLSKNVCRWYENGTGKNLCCADAFPCPEQKDKDHFIKVPYKVGTKVYVITSQTSDNRNLYIFEDVITHYVVCDNYTLMCFENHIAEANHNWDKVFLIKEEAEAKLKECEGK